MPTTAEVSDGYITFHRIKESDQGRYRCRAVNLAGEADGVAEVVVQGKTCYSFFIFMCVKI